MTFTDDRDRALSGADRDVSLLAKDQYFRELAWAESMSREEEDKLLRRVCRGNAERLQPCPNQWVLSLAKHARERLVEVYQPLVVWVARRYHFLFKSMELLDVVQEGNIGLLHAFDEYTDELASVYPFRAIARTRIKHTLSAAAAIGCSSLIRLPKQRYEVLRRKHLVTSALQKHYGRQPSLAEIAEFMDVSEESLQQLLDYAKRQEVASLHEVLEFKDIPEDHVSFTSLYASAVVSEDQRQQELAAMFQQVFETAMPDKQVEVLTLRYGFGDAPGATRSYGMVGEMVESASGRVYAIEQEAKERLGGLLEPVVLPDGRLSCMLSDLYSEDYCTSHEAAVLLGTNAREINLHARAGRLPFEMRARRRGHGPKERVFKKGDVVAFRQELMATPSKRWYCRHDESLAAARRSAALPSVVA